MLSLLLPHAGLVLTGTVHGHIIYEAKGLGRIDKTVRSRNLVHKATTSLLVHLPPELVSVMILGIHSYSNNCLHY
jgi:hypothetical protein